MRINLEEKYLTDIQVIVVNNDIKTTGKFLLNYVPFNNEKTSLLIPYGPAQSLGKAYNVIGKEVSLAEDLRQILQIGDILKFIYISLLL